MAPPTTTHPFLTVGIRQIVDSFRVPLFSNAEEVSGSETVFGHDDEVDEETGRGLDHAYLTVSHRDQPKHRRHDQKELQGVGVDVLATASRNDVVIRQC